MSEDAATARLTRALAERGLADARDAYRARLRALRTSDPDAFRRATAYYEAEVTPRLESADDPIEVWIEYGRMLGELSGPGRLVAIDATGRAQTHRPPLPDSTLVLFMPEENTQDVLTAVMPASPSRAQQAAHALLVEKRLGL
ncbi:MAG: hypothetical protein L0271_10945 [Gemmatimonadetes bacterium]|nr:hypothetical protein [Gemmatimonadota bacterium]